MNRYCSITVFWLGISLNNCGSSVTLGDASGVSDNNTMVDTVTDQPRDLSPPTDGEVLDAITVQGLSLAMFEGRTVHLALENRVNGMIEQTSVTMVRSGGFTVNWPSAFHRDHFGMLLHIYVDNNADNVCSSADPQWSVFVNNDFQLGSVVVVSFDPNATVMSTMECMYFP